MYTESPKKNPPNDESHEKTLRMSPAKIMISGARAAHQKKTAIVPRALSETPLIRPTCIYVVIKTTHVFTQ